MRKQQHVHSHERTTLASNARQQPTGTVHHVPISGTLSDVVAVIFASMDPRRRGCFVRNWSAIGLTPSGGRFGRQRCGFAAFTEGERRRVGLTGYGGVASAPARIALPATVTRPFILFIPWTLILVHGDSLDGA